MKNLFVRVASIAIAICFYVMPLTASASGLRPGFTKVEGTPISYAVGTPSKYLETVVNTYTVLPDNVRTYMAAVGMDIYVVKEAEAGTLPDHTTASKKTAGFTSVHYDDSAATYIVLMSDGTRSDATLPLIHETGHYIDAFCDSSTKGYVSNSQEFGDLVSEYGDVLKKMSSEHSHVKLHTESASEVYAESFVMYMCWPEELAENAPEMYDFIATTSSALVAQ